MAEITAEDAKRMSCTKLKKLDCWYLVEADRGEPCPKCQESIRRGFGDCARCSEKAAPPAAQRSRRKEKEQTPAPTLRPYPVVEKSLLMPTTSEAVMVYGSCYAGKRVDQRHGYETPQLEHRTPLVLQLLDDEGKCVLDERRIVRMTGWEDVANDWERHLGVFGFDPRADEQVYSIRRCDVVDRITVTPYIRENLGKYSVDALVALASRNGLIDKESVLCDCFTMLAGGVAALAHDPEAQETYCDKLTRIVGDLFRKDLAKVSVATDLLALATPAANYSIQKSSLEGSLGTLSSLCDTIGAQLPISSVVSVIPMGGNRGAQIYAAAGGTVRKEVFMVTGAKQEGGISKCRCPLVSVVFIDVRRSLSRYGRTWVSPRVICTHAAHEDPQNVDRRGDVRGRGAGVYPRFGISFDRGHAFH